MPPRRYDVYGFRTGTLAEAAKMVERVLGIRLRLRDSSYRGLYFSGWVVGNAGCSAAGSPWSRHSASRPPRACPARQSRPTCGSGHIARSLGPKWDETSSPAGSGLVRSRPASGEDADRLVGCGHLVDGQHQGRGAEVGERPGSPGLACLATGVGHGVGERSSCVRVLLLSWRRVRLSGSVLQPRSDELRWSGGAACDWQ